MGVGGKITYFWNLSKMKMFFLSKLRGGGGGQSNFDICQNFFGFFFFEGFPNRLKTIRMFPFSPDVPQLATGLSLLQQMESV